MHKYSLYRFFCRRLTVAEAELCKVRSKHLLLLQEVNVPRRGELMRGRGSVSSSACDTCFVGGESGPSQDMISRLLEDAMSSDVDFAGVEEEHKYRKRFFFSHTPYMPVLIVHREDADRYGFKHDIHEDENAVETMANKLLQQSQRLEVSGRCLLSIRVFIVHVIRQDTDAAHFVRWENYLLHRGKKELEYSVGGFGGCVVVVFADRFVVL